MLRPATPLSVLLFIAFAFLLVASISTPIVKAIPLGTYNGVDFGVFGYCQGNKCSSIKIGYSMCKFCEGSLHWRKSETDVTSSKHLHGQQWLWRLLPA